MVQKDGPKPIAAVVGAGRTKFGELWYDNPEKLLVEAGLACVESVAIAIAVCFSEVAILSAVDVESGLMTAKYKTKTVNRQTSKPPNKPKINQILLFWLTNF